VNNRRERRAEAANLKRLARAARVRCVACERVSQRMSREHFWPQWLVRHAGVLHDGVRWMDIRGLNPKSATLPLCTECNSRLGHELEEPVSRLLPRAEEGHGISHSEAVLLVRWMWKFEGLAAAYFHAGDPRWRYAEAGTLIQTVLDPLIAERVLGDLMLVVGFAHRNDPAFRDGPMGLDSAISDLDAVFVSGVFGKTALLVSAMEFDHLIPACMGRYRFNSLEVRSVSEPSFFPPTCFPYCTDAVQSMREISGPLKAAHERRARLSERARLLHIARPRIEIEG
jgi:hypothetical protein